MAPRRTGWYVCKRSALLSVPRKLTVCTESSAGRNVELLLGANLASALCVIVLIHFQAFFALVDIKSLRFLQDFIAFVLGYMTLGGLECFFSRGGILDLLDGKLYRIVDQKSTCDCQSSLASQVVAPSNSQCEYTSIVLRCSPWNTVFLTKMLADCAVHWRNHIGTRVGSWKHLLTSHTSKRIRSMSCVCRCLGRQGTGESRLYLLKSVVECVSCDRRWR